MKHEADPSVEVVILLILGMFMLIFGFLLFGIHTGKLAYNPDSAYGLFLVIVSFQVITMGKTPFGDLRRSWALITIGICAAIIGIFSSFIPGHITGFTRILVGAILLGGGLTLLAQLLTAEKKARMWMAVGGVLRQLTVACAVSYLLAVVIGVITLFPATTTDLRTALLLIAYGLSFFYLSWCIWKVRRQYPESATTHYEEAGSEVRLNFFREASLPLAPAILLVLGVLLTMQGLLLFPARLGVIAFSPDGQFGLLLTVTAIQMMSLGNTPVGQFKRSWFMIVIGLIFAALGVVSSIVPGLRTGTLRILLGLLNLSGAARSLITHYRPMLRERSTRSTFIQTTVSWVQIAVGVFALIPGVVPGLIMAGILVVNGLLLLVLASALQKVPAAT